MLTRNNNQARGPDVDSGANEVGEPYIPTLWWALQNSHLNL